LRLRNFRLRFCDKLAIKTELFGCISGNLTKKGKPIVPVSPVKKPLRPLGVYLALDREGVKRGEPTP
jgi:hypothetical protein